ncbi:hypothetical protein [Anaerococcus tetradius]|uniref:Uncharacterized protein n=1 Tax=Anaerococcus tetradius TaxID=33036 RepID=A0A133KD78_9FIRM|nr:hypothetical protein [Anaerococcus tetradius]KWZ77424.1 hypothetical protein HMPREF3200_01417 [Anaerococcus tetradius]
MINRCKYLNDEGEITVADLYGIFQFSSIIQPSLMIGGDNGGVIAYPVVVIGDRGQLKEIKVTRIKEVYEVRE